MSGLSVKSQKIMDFIFTNDETRFLQLKGRDIMFFGGGQFRHFCVPIEQNVIFEKCQILQNVYLIKPPCSRRFTFVDCQLLEKVECPSGIVSFVKCARLKSLFARQDFLDVSHCSLLERLVFRGQEVKLPDVEWMRLDVKECTVWNVTYLRGKTLCLDTQSLSTCPPASFQAVKIEAAECSVVDLRHVKTSQVSLPIKCIALIKFPTVARGKDSNETLAPGCRFLEKCTAQSALSKLLVVTFLQR